jgi:hypothetical protein
MASRTTTSDATIARSEESRQFEALWRSLRRSGLIPHRCDFRPAKARHLLRDLVLLEAPAAPHPCARIRISGEGFNEAAGQNMAGRDHLELLPAQYRAGAVATSEMMVNRPCGLWQVSPIHLARGYAIHLEMTAFPLRADDGGPPCLLAHVRPVQGFMAATLPTPNGLSIDTAVTFRFLDIGAGVPEWTAQAA